MQANLFKMVQRDAKITKHPTTNVQHVRLAAHWVFQLSPDSSYHTPILKDLKVFVSELSWLDQALFLLGPYKLGIPTECNWPILLQLKPSRPPFEKPSQRRTSFPLRRKTKFGLPPPTPRWVKVPSTWYHAWYLLGNHHFLGETYTLKLQYFYYCSLLYIYIWSILWFYPTVPYFHRIQSSTLFLLVCDHSILDTWTSSLGLRMLFQISKLLRKPMGVGLLLLRSNLWNRSLNHLLQMFEPSLGKSRIWENQQLAKALEVCSSDL